MSNLPEFSDFTGMIKKIAYRKSQQYGLEQEELEGQAGLLFVEALSRFDHNKGMKFSTFFHMILEHEMVGWQRQPSSFSMRDHNKKVMFQESENDWNDKGWTEIEFGESSFAPPHVIAEFKDTLRTLSGDSKEIVKMIFEAPEDIVDGAIGRGKFMAGNVRKKLKAQGWSDWKIWNCFTEIRGIL